MKQDQEWNENGDANSRDGVPLGETPRAFAALAEEETGDE
jgi:hypothetical protein